MMKSELQDIFGKFEINLRLMFENMVVEIEERNKQYFKEFLVTIAPVLKVVREAQDARAASVNKTAP